MKRRPYERIVFLQEFSQWGCNLGEISDESSIVVDEAKERLDIVDAGKVRPIDYRLDFAGVDGDTFFGDDVTEESDFRLEELALGQLGVQLVLF